jgi:purine-binding chemotaxis protein CheW
VDTVDLLVCSLGQERYGVDLAHVLDVAVAAGLTPVPCTPPFILGAVSHRGRILSVVDFRLLVEPAAEPARGALVVAVEAEGMEFGVAADEVSGVVRISATEIALPSGAPARGRDRVVRGVTADLVSVLDLEALARHPRLEVRDDVG